MLDLREKKIGIFGVPGSGKTHFAKRLLQSFNSPLIYRVTSDFDNEGENVKIFKPTDIYHDLDLFIRTVKTGGSRGKIDCMVIDDFDLFAQRCLELGSPLNEMVLMHRHWGISEIYVSHRPQDIPQKVFENMHHTFVFPLEGELATDKLTKWDARFADLLPYLSMERHNFIHKELMKPPALCAPIGF